LGSAQSAHWGRAVKNAVLRHIGWAQQAAGTVVAGDAIDMPLLGVYFKPTGLIRETLFNSGKWFRPDTP
jgi:hypothetical protein